MRRIMWVSLLCLVVGTEGVRAEEAPPRDNKEPITSNVVSEPGKNWPKTVLGYGETYETAKQRAMEEAVEEVSLYLLDRNPRLRWSPSREYLEESGIVKETSHNPKFTSSLLGELHRVEITVDVTEDHYRGIVRIQREVFWGKILGALVAVLALVAGYFRLEDATKGYYTGILRLSLVLSIGLVSGGLWLVL